MRAYGTETFNILLTKLEGLIHPRLDSIKVNIHDFKPYFSTNKKNLVDNDIIDNLTLKAVEILLDDSDRILSIFDRD